MSSLNSALSLSRCDLCGNIRDGRELLCSACGNDLRIRVDGYCSKCGLLYPDGRGVYTCGQCRLVSPPWETLGFYNAYSGLLQEIILDFKFRGRLGLTKILKHLITKVFAHHFTNQSFDCLIPVPAHERRLLKRGFNQSHEMAKMLSQETGIPVAGGILFRIRNTPPQSGLPKKVRLSNLRGAFQTREGLSGVNALLIDDVYTTGTTLKSCVRAVKRAGCSSVSVLVLARS